MKTELFPRSLYLTIVLIVTMAVGGCISWPGKTTYDTPESPHGIREGKTHKTVVLEKLGNPDEQTEDGRLALHDYMRTRRWHSVGYIEPGSPIPTYAEERYHARLLLLVIYDQNNIIERLKTYKCKSRYKSGDPVCRSEYSICGVLIESDDQALVQRYCDSPAIDYFLRDAVTRGDPEEIERLIALGADIHGPGEAGRTPLLLVAVKRGHVDVVRLLAQGGNVNAKAKGGHTPLHWAVKLGHKEVAELLIAKGADVNAKDKQGTTPLYLAVRGDHIAVVKLLLTHGADVNAKDKHGITPMRAATRFRRKGIIELLKQHGAKE